jgi:hypothetical protein
MLMHLYSISFRNWVEAEIVYIATSMNNRDSANPSFLTNMVAAAIFYSTRPLSSKAAEVDDAHKL